MGNAHLYELAVWWAWEQELTHSQRLALGGTGEMVPPLTTEVRGGALCMALVWEDSGPTMTTHPSTTPGAWLLPGGALGGRLEQVPLSSPKSRP